MRVRGKDMRLQRNQRICEVCFREVEDETHVLLKCPAYKAARAKLLGMAGVAAVQAAEQGGKDSKAERMLVEWRRVTMEFLRVMMRKRKQILE